MKRALIALSMVLVCVLAGWLLFPDAGFAAGSSSFMLIGMATATNLSSSERTKTLKYTHSAATVADTIYLLAGRVMVALAAAAANAANIFIYGAERIEVPKAAAQAWTAGATIYWDNAANNFTTTATANTKAGIAVEDAAAAATLGVIELNNTVNF